MLNRRGLGQVVAVNQDVTGLLWTGRQVAGRLESKVDSGGPAPDRAGDPEPVTRLDQPFAKIRAPVCRGTGPCASLVRHAS